MALDRGGQCWAFSMSCLTTTSTRSLESSSDVSSLTSLPTAIPRWVTVETATGPMKALAFVMNRSSPRYTGRLPLDDVADILSRACGHWGTGAEYLLNTVSHFEAKGIADGNLWRLQRLVAERIDAMRSSPMSRDRRDPQSRRSPAASRPGAIAPGGRRPAGA